jgi:hypothetical protein
MTRIKSLTLTTHASATVLVAASTVAVVAENWPAWRGDSSLFVDQIINESVRLAFFGVVGGQLFIHKISCSMVCQS